MWVMSIFLNSGRNWWATQAAWSLREKDSPRFLGETFLRPTQPEASHGLAEGSPQVGWKRWSRRILPLRWDDDDIYIYMYIWILYVLYMYKHMYIFLIQNIYLLFCSHFSLAWSELAKWKTHLSAARDCDIDQAKLAAAGGAHDCWQPGIVVKSSEGES